PKYQENSPGFGPQGANRRGIIPSAHSSQLSNTSKRKTPPKYDGVCQRSEMLQCFAAAFFV
ncbi:hypothetical protein, partial [Thalassospira sp.]|uniref:hypothetical protein n=1 Tax=Thalassospira sp. TaxID=1912094 RepID=UPI002579CD02